jgi:hypothetical protein
MHQSPVSATVIRAPYFSFIVFKQSFEPDFYSLSSQNTTTFPKLILPKICPRLLHPSKNMSPCRGRDTGCPVPPSQIPAGGIPAPYVAHHIRCVMWSTWLCGAGALKALIHWVISPPTPHNILHPGPVTNLSLRRRCRHVQNPLPYSWVIPRRVTQRANQEGPMGVF